MSTNLTKPKRRFFNIPSVKVGQGQKRQRWISAIKQVNGINWEPKRPHDIKHGDKVCSSHFKSGNHSLIQFDDDYVPNIFNNDFEKYQRKQATEKILITAPMDESEAEAEISIDLPPSDNCSQVDFDVVSLSSSPGEYLCRKKVLTLMS